MRLQTRQSPVQLLQLHYSYQLAGSSSSKDAALYTRIVYENYVAYLTNTVKQNYHQSGEEEM